MRRVRNVRPDEVDLLSRPPGGAHDPEGRQSPPGLRPLDQLDELADLLNQCVETCAFLADHRRTAHEGHERTIGVLNADCRRAFTSFDYHLDLAVLLFLRLENTTERANPVDLLGAGLVDGGVVLSG